ncbi:MAG: hypothetical protein ABIV21_00655 [Pyrinomonadaceae bacterium]
MGKLILVVIAVICLMDVGFNAVVSIDSQAEVAKHSINEVLDASDLDSNRVSELALSPFDTGEDVILAETGVRSKRPVPLFAVSIARRRKPETSYHAINRGVLPATHVITIRAPERYALGSRPRTEHPHRTVDKIEAARRDEIYALATTANTHKADKNSFIASTFKKPWDFIKAIGSKFR